MVITDMRDYDYYVYEGKDAYGQPQLSEDVKGKVKLAIYVVSQSIQDNILYNSSQFVGLTWKHTEVNDTYVIQYGKERLKVLYVNPHGAYKQVYLQRM